MATELMIPGSCMTEFWSPSAESFLPIAHQEKVKLRPVRPDALDALDVSDATSVNRTQRATAPCVRTKNATAYAYQTRSVRAFSFQTQPGLPNPAVEPGRRC